MNQIRRKRLSAAATGAALEALVGVLGNKIVTSASVCSQHAHTTTWLATEAPDAVLFATETDDIITAVRICASHDLPVVPFGAGTSLEGQTNAPFGGLSLDLCAMNEVIELFPEDMVVRVQPGVTHRQLNGYLRDTGLFFPVDPGADATLGGMAATRASGTNAVRYGTMKDVVLALDVVGADGEKYTTASRAKKSSAGYDLTRLFVGSEGTLGVICGLTLKLFGVPEVTTSGMCAFPSVEAACNAVIETVQFGIPITRIELLDGVQIAACNAYSKLGLEEMPTLFVEFGGTKNPVNEQAAQFAEIALGCGGGAMKWASEPGAREKLWQARHDVFWAALSMRPGAKVVATDACVPISKLAECVVLTQADIAGLGFPAPIVGHVGDGNFHVQLLVDMGSDDELARAKAFTERLALRAIKMGGTCTGEHGIGQGKAEMLVKELGPAVAHMRAIKQALDPGNIMNPGKLGF
jgi:D-lactate dehydrogenase (cytochrome)